MKKVVVIITIVFLVLVCALGGFYVWGMGAKSENNEIKIFTILPGTSKQDIVKNLAKEGLIRSEYPLLAYLFFHGGNIQAGDYELSENMPPAKMVDKFIAGEVKLETVKLTFLEGSRITDYGEVIAENLDIPLKTFIDKVNDKEYLQNLIKSEEYWFLTEEILQDGIYYPLEGYLYPNTYEFYENTTMENIIETLLKETKKQLEPYKEAILNSGYTTHQILTMASIVDKEAKTLDNRKTVSQVFWTRLRDNWSLGSDVTSYYGVQKDLTEGITIDELLDQNPYNTRLTDGTMNGKLPIGPICNADVTSVEATLNPSPTNYYYFVANVCTGEVFFQTTSAEFEQKASELRSVCSAN